jgi:pyruvyl transferase EpsO
MRRRERTYRRHAAYRLACGVRKLSRGQVIVSDRLHAHLIAGLMGKPHVCLDNSYGKIGRYIETWGKDNQTLQVSTPQEIKAALEQLKDRVTG